MAIEVACGQCQGRLLAETPGTVVACPHCGTHLAIPGEPTTADSVVTETDLSETDASFTTSGGVEIVDATTEDAPAAEVVDDAVTATAEPVEPTADALPAYSVDMERGGEDDGSVFDDDEATLASGVHHDAEEWPRQKESAKAETDAADAEKPDASGIPPEAEMGGNAVPAADDVASDSCADAETIISQPESQPIGEQSGPAGLPVPVFNAAASVNSETAAWVPPGDENNDFGHESTFGASSPEFDADADFTQPVERMSVPAFDDATEQEFGGTEAWAGEPVSVGEGRPQPTMPAVEAGDGGQAAWGAALGTATWETAVEPTQAAAQQPAGTASGGVGQAAVVKKSRGWTALAVMILISYASAVTIAFIFFILQAGKPKAHDLESLPDVIPKVGKTGKIGLPLVPEDAPMAPGHTLQLGEQQRFGSLLVTAVKVTRGPLEFDYFDANSKQTRAPSASVLKLWLQFENVSQDQVFAPLDRKLLLTRSASMQGSEHDRANNFVCRKSQKKRGGERVLVYELPEDSPWDFRGQQIGKELQPGETLVTFIPTAEEGIDELDGHLVWRVHFRKGYNPDSRHGVTTLIEVEFHREEVLGDSTGVTVAGS